METKIIIEHHNQGKKSEFLLFKDYFKTKHDEKKAILKKYIKQNPDLKFVEYKHEIKDGGKTEYLLNENGEKIFKKRIRDILDKNGMRSVVRDKPHNRLFVHDRKLIEYIIENHDKRKFHIEDNPKKFKKIKYKDPDLWGWQGKIGTSRMTNGYSDYLKNQHQL